DPEATAAFIKDLRFQKNNKRKTPEPEEDAISWGSDTEPAPLGDAEMEDAYGQDFSDDDYGDMDYSNNFENQTVDGTMQVSSRIHSIQDANDHFQGPLRVLNGSSSKDRKYIAQKTFPPVFISAYSFIHNNYAACIECQ
ncbi:hypothetical protein H0H81_011025, partial [Sphagnurus paluster]